MPKSSNIPNDLITQLNEVFLRYGYRSPSMDDLAKNVGISKKTLYRYVSNKEELIIVCLKFQFKQFKEAFIRIENLESVELSMQQLFKELATFFQQFSLRSVKDLATYYPHANEHYAFFRNKKLIGYLRKHLKKGKQLGVYHEKVSVTFTAHLILKQIEQIEWKQFAVNSNTINTTLQQFYAYNLQSLKKC